MPEFGIHRQKTYTHNYFSYVLLHYGVLGFVTVLSILTSICSTFWLGYKDGINRDLRKCALACFAGLIGTLTYVQFQAIHKSLSFMVYLAILIAYAARMEQMRRQSRVCGESMECGMNRDFED